MDVPLVPGPGPAARRGGGAGLDGGWEPWTLPVSISTTVMSSAGTPGAQGTPCR